MLLTTLGQTYRSSAVRQQVTYFATNAWQDWVPIVNWIHRLVTLEDAKKEYDLITYKFVFD